MNAFPLHAVVRTRVQLQDTEGRMVPAATQGAIVFVHLAAEPAAYEVEVVAEDGRTTHLFTARHSELELVPNRVGRSPLDIT